MGETVVALAMFAATFIASVAAWANHEDWFLVLGVFRKRLRQMKASLVREIAKDVKRMLPKEFKVKKAKILNGKELLALGEYKGQELLFKFEGFGNVKIAKNSSGYVVYNGNYKILPRKDIREIISALFGECKTYKGMWHWKGEMFTQSIPM